MSDLDYLIDSFGDSNKEIEPSELSELVEEILTLDEDELFDITCESISCGKWQILGCILEEKEFEPKQIETMKRTLEDYVNENDEEDEDEDIEDIDNIGEKMETLISNLENHNADRWIQKMSHKKGGWTKKGDWSTKKGGWTKKYRK